jgi:hypothetical protein
MVDHMVILIVELFSKLHAATKNYLLSRINVVAKVIESRRIVNYYSSTPTNRDRVFWNFGFVYHEDMLKGMVRKILVVHRVPES